MKFLVAPNSFKGSLTAWDVADIIEKAIIKVFPEAEVINLPVADGGDHTMEVLVRALKGAINTYTISDPLSRPISANIGVIKDGKTAIIEMASASGIRLLKDSELSPMKTTSFGTGELIKEAIKSGCEEVILSIGGSATVDGGLGILAGLGFSLLNENNISVEPSGRGLRELAKIENTLVDPSIKSVKFKVLCDVDNPLLGEHGAAKVFGPQKGANDEMVGELEEGLKIFNRLTNKTLGIDMNSMSGSGAAGGVGGAMAAYLNAELIPGANFVIDQLNIVDHLRGCDYVFVAEGKIDNQTRFGKAPYAVAERSGDIPVIALAGQVDPDLDTSDLPAFNAIFSITNGPVPLEKALKNTPTNLGRTVENICRTIKSAF
ncbi:MAG: glycerate kinase [Cyclobacteriaceae bacterium]